MWQPGKPSHDENEYFIRRDAEWLREQRAKLDAERAAKQKQLVCPRCHGTLTEHVKAGVTLDSCGNCHGVWLDAGELTMLAHLNDKALLRVAHQLGAGNSPG